MKHKSYGYVEKATLIQKKICYYPQNLTLVLNQHHLVQSISMNLKKMGNLICVLRYQIKMRSLNLPQYILERSKNKSPEPASIYHKGKIEPIKRPVVMMNIKIGNKTRTIPVNLTNRKRFNYPLICWVEMLSLPLMVLLILAKHS